MLLTTLIKCQYGGRVALEKHTNVRQSSVVKVLVHNVGLFFTVLGRRERKKEIHEGSNIQAVTGLNEA